MSSWQSSTKGTVLGWVLVILLSVVLLVCLLPVLIFGLVASTDGETCESFDCSSREAAQAALHLRDDGVLEALVYDCVGGRVTGVHLTGRGNGSKSTSMIDSLSGDLGWTDRERLAVVPLVTPDGAPRARGGLPQPWGTVHDYQALGVQIDVDGTWYGVAPVVADVLGDGRVHTDSHVYDDVVAYHAAVSAICRQRDVPSP